MTKEELFKKNFPQYCTEKGKCLSPFYDMFEAGVELAIAELNKGIIQSLTKENAELKKTVQPVNCGNVPIPKVITFKEHIRIMKERNNQYASLLNEYNDLVESFNKLQKAYCDVTGEWYIE